jgi:hypothetical protein
MDIGGSFMKEKRPGFESDHYFNPVQMLSMELYASVHSLMPLRFGVFN